MTLFTGSSKVAEKLAVDLKGQIKLEDAGFDWKILGPDVNEVSVVSCKYYLLSTIIFVWIKADFKSSLSVSEWQVDYIAWVCDQDAYACSGQKCSAQSILFMHEVSCFRFLCLV
jgi:1-pyrroline-5-carboxylate dehydrogenase